MCRNIRTLHDFEPPATEDAVRAADEEAFDRAVDAAAAASRRLLGELTTTAPPKDREAEAAKARERARRRDAA
jgi:hypothetical protein